MELSQVTRNFPVEMVSLLNLGITCELMNKLDKAIEWHTLVSLNTIVLSNGLRKLEVMLYTILQSHTAVTDTVLKELEYQFHT